MKILWANQANISHADYRKLHLEGKCNLGVPNDLAEKIATESGLMSGSSAGTKNWIGIFLSLGVLLYSIYLSFTWAWWSFILGFILAAIIDRLNRKNTSKDVLKYALENEDFYNRLVGVSSVSFQISEDIAANYEIS